MKTRVAINGFGRIGRLVFRQMFEDDNFEIVGINDLTDAKTLAYLLKYDTAQGGWKSNEITFTEDSIIIEGQEFKVFALRNPEELPWGDLKVDVVLECTGFFRTTEKAGLHLKAGAKKVVVSAPGDEKMKTIVFGVNEEVLVGDETIISAASCTTNCLAPMAKVLNDNFTIKQGMMTTIHAYTNDQNTLDGPHKDLRRGRAAAENIVPNSTGAAKAIGLVIPELKGKLDGGAQRVPVVTGSLTELVVTLEEKVTVEAINEAMFKKRSEAFGYTEEEIVSSDIIGSTFGSLFDATQTKVLEVAGEQLVKVAAWYDNENSYVSNMIRTIGYFAKKK